MTTLQQLCSLIRSKNAGPFSLTFDLIFSSPDNYARAKRAQVITPALISRLYGAPIEQVTLVYHDGAQAIKASIPRPCVQCDPGDADCYGGQQYVPLLDLPVP